MLGLKTIREKESHSTQMLTNDEQPAAKKAQVDEHAAVIQRSVELINALAKRSEELTSNMKSVREEIANYCNEVRKMVDELEADLSRELEENYTHDDEVLQQTIYNLRELLGRQDENTEEWAKESLAMVKKAELSIISKKTYVLNKVNIQDLSGLCKMNIECELVPECIHLKQPKCTAASGGDNAFFNINAISTDEEDVSVEYVFKEMLHYKVAFRKKGEDAWTEQVYEKKDDGVSLCNLFVDAETVYEAKVKTLLGSKESEWSDVVEFMPSFKECCIWKRCPDGILSWLKYGVNKNNHRIARKKINRVVDFDLMANIVGNITLPLGKVTSWSVKIHKSRNEDGDNIYIGIAPNDINQNKWLNCFICGWYFNCYYSTLNSGPPHRYRGKAYGPRKGAGQYVHTGDSVGVVMDTANGELSFVLNGVNRGAAYWGIPLDKPLVPCVLLGYSGDSVELDTSEAREAVLPKDDDDKNDGCIIS